MCSCFVHLFCKYGYAQRKILCINETPEEADVDIDLIILCVKYDSLSCNITA